MKIGFNVRFSQMLANTPVCYIQVKECNTDEIRKHKREKAIQVKEGITGEERF